MQKAVAQATLHEAPSLVMRSGPERTADISGNDAFRKLMILSALAFDNQPNWRDVPVVRIKQSSSRDVQE